MTKTLKNIAILQVGLFLIPALIYVWTCMVKAGSLAVQCYLGSHSMDILTQVLCFATVVWSIIGIPLSYFVFKVFQYGFKNNSITQIAINMVVFLGYAGLFAANFQDYYGH